MFVPWLTGCVETDARELQRQFKTARLRISEWRQVVKETMAHYHIVEMAPW